MDQVVVKTEMNSNDEILLFYVDEDGGNEEGVVTTVQNLDKVAAAQLQLHEENAYIIDENIPLEYETVDETHASVDGDDWLDNETRRLLVFYTDNKTTFTSGITKKKHLWTVACKTMLTEKNPVSCETKLRNLKRKYVQIRVEHNSEEMQDVSWPYYELCHQAFHDDPSIHSMITELVEAHNQGQIIAANNYTSVKSEEGIVVVKKVNSSRNLRDEKVDLMLNLYLKYKKRYQKDFKQRNIWGTIVLEMGETDADFWQKRFLNFKQHYLRLLDKRKISGSNSINWPYMNLFDRIFENDEEFQRKYFIVNNEEKSIETEPNDLVDIPYDWDETEITVLAKYYYDCFQEFQDSTIPNNFLWTEVGRLLDKSPDDCQNKFMELKNLHYDKIFEGGYDLRTRTPVEILYDNIIASEVKLEMSQEIEGHLEMWKTEELDEMVQFFYENIEMFKDPICYFVCWAAIVRKLKRTLTSCRQQWADLTSLYMTILDDKREDPDMQIDWRYIELFDRIFDYGMDINLLNGYEKNIEVKEPVVQDKIGVKKVNINLNQTPVENGGFDDEEYDEKGFIKQSKKSGEAKAFKILDFFINHKDKFLSSKRKKQSLWEELGKQIGLTAEQCAHRFRNLKQVYTTYLQREIKKPGINIVWPYYAQCKKVFGYRVIKGKLKNEKDSDEEGWSIREIKKLISYLAENFEVINNGSDDDSKWTDLAQELGKSESMCNDKFLEIRKSYRKLRTMKIKNPDMNVTWKFFNMMDDLYRVKENGSAETGEVLQETQQDTVMMTDSEVYGELELNDEIRLKMQDEDFQCIIVIPEGQDINDLNNAQIISKENGELLFSAGNADAGKKIVKWTKRSKKNLLTHYLNYIRTHKGKVINAKDMWDEIALKLPNKSALSCRKMFARLKANYKNVEDNANANKSPYYGLLERIVASKPKFSKSSKVDMLVENKAYKDVPLPAEKVVQVLQYYLEHIEDFMNPRFDQKYLWTELAKHVLEPVAKVYHKLNYLKKHYNAETDEVAGDKTPYTELLNMIVSREYALKSIADPEPKVAEVPNEQQSWTDDEVEQLLIWYLANLDKFKNPKFVRSYLWKEVSNLLFKSPLDCSKKMSEIRTTYRTLVKETPEVLSTWRFYELCQKIYGTGKKSTSETSN